MDVPIFFKGILLGLAIAAPVGPIALLCIHKSVQFGRLSGLMSGLGAATADAFYGAIAAFGLTFISDILLSSHICFRMIGGIFLILFGLKIFFTKIDPLEQEISHKTLTQDFLSTFFLTLTNPLTLAAYFALFAALGLSTLHGNYVKASRLVAGVFVGSSLWWLLLTETVAFFKDNFSERFFRYVTRIAGLVMMGFGIAAWATLCF